MNPLKSGQKRNNLLVAGFIILAVYVILPQLKSFNTSWRILGHLDFSWVLIGVLFTGLTYLAAAGTYYWLAFKPLAYWLTAEVQLAAMFVNRLLPAGIGAVGANYAYLRHAKHSQNQAASVVAINNLLGALGHGLLALSCLLFGGQQIRLINHGRGGTWQHDVELLAVFVVLALIVGLWLGQRRMRSRLTDLSHQFLSYSRRPWRLAAALLTSMSLTACNLLCLWACSLAANLHLPLAVLFIIFTFGVSLGTATPTPGGLGGFEAGLFAGLVAYHVAVGPALAVALLYRLISYWLVLIIGAAAFGMSQRQKLFSVNHHI